MNRSDLCKDCPKTVKKLAFSRETERLWETFIGEKQSLSLDFRKTFSFLQLVLTTLRVPEAERSAETNVFCDIYLLEEDRFDEQEQKLKAAGS